MAEDSSLTWEQVREGAAEGLAPIEADPDTGLPVPTVQVSQSVKQPTIWPWVVGFGVVIWLLSRK